MKKKITGATRTPAFWEYRRPMITHTINSYRIPFIPSQNKSNLGNLPKIQSLQVSNKINMRHTFWGCVIRCINRKWISWVLLKIKIRHDSIYEQTDGRTDKVKPVYPTFNFFEVEGMNTNKYCIFILIQEGRYSSNIHHIFIIYHTFTLY